MKHSRWFIATALIFAMVACLTTVAQTNPISEIGPFIGTLQEDWEQPNFPFAGWGGGYYMYPDHTVLTIMGGAATLTNEQLFIWSNGGSSVGTSGYSVAAHGNQGLGENVGSPATITLTFLNPVSSFGGYFQAYTNDSVNPVPITFKFYDASDNLLDTKTYDYLHANGDGLMDWHGWSFDTPVKTITWTETAGANDYLQATPIPEPATMLLLGSGLIGLAGFARKRFKK